MTSRHVDSYDLRRAIAALVWVRHNLELLDDRHLQLVDGAVTYLGSKRRHLGGDVGNATESLLSRADDVGGRRTVRAIDRLGELTQVEPDAADAIASLQPRPQNGQLQLFDPDVVDHTEAG